VVPYGLSGFITVYVWLCMFILGESTPQLVIHDDDFCITDPLIKVWRYSEDVYQQGRRVLHGFASSELPLDGLTGHWSVPGGLGCCHCHPRCFCRGSAKTWGAATKSPAQMARANQVLGPLLVYRSIACLCKQPVEPTASSRCSWPLWNIYEHFGFSTASPCLV
jgi:hypothetical protein